MKMTTTGSYDADGRCGLLLRSSSTHAGLVAGLSRLVVQPAPLASGMDHSTFMLRHTTRGTSLTSVPRVSG
jgi:hypothetical protein